MILKQVLISLKKVSKFKRKVLKVVSNIKKGSTKSYKEVAKLAGSPKAWRAVGNILHNNNDPNVPCHRVIKSDGKIGGYKDGKKTKRKKLKKEGAL